MQIEDKDGGDSDRVKGKGFFIADATDGGEIYSSPGGNDEENISCDSGFESPLCGWNKQANATQLTDSSYEMVRVRKDTEPNPAGPSSSKRGHSRDGMNQKRFTETQPSPGSFSDVSREAKQRRVRPVPSGNLRRGPISAHDGFNGPARPARIRRGMPETSSQGGRCQVHITQSSRGNLKTPVAMNYRSNVQSVVKDIRTIPFSSQHIRAIKKTPFWLFVDAALKMSNPSIFNRFKKRDHNISRLVKRFRVVDEQKGFMFGDAFMTPVREDVELIFGIRDGAIPVKPGAGSVAITGFLKRCFPGKIENRGKDRVVSHYKLSPSLCKSVLLSKVALGDKAPAEDVARLLHIYLLATFFIPNQNLSLNWRVTEIIDNFDNICNFDWCTYILDELMTDISNSRQGRIGSCAVFLLFWLCEHADLGSPIPDYSSFPRFLKWDLTELAAMLSNIDLDNLDSHVRLIWEITPTVEELELLDGEITGSSVEKAKGVVIKENQRGHNSKLKEKECSDGGPSLSQVMATSQPIGFDLGFCDDDIPNVGTPTEGTQVDNTEVWVDSFFSDGPMPDKDANDVVSDINKSACKSASSFNAEQYLAIKIKELEADLENANSSILRLKCDLEVKDKTKSVEEHKANQAFREASRDMIDCLRADLVESRHVQDRLGSQVMNSQKRIKVLEEECGQYKDKLAVEIEKCMKLTNHNAELEVSSRDNLNRKIELVIENDRMKSQIVTLNKQLDDVMSMGSVGALHSSSATVSVPAAGGTANMTAAPLCSKGSDLHPVYLGPSGTSMASAHYSAKGKQLYTPINSIGGSRFGEIGGVKLFNSPGDNANPITNSMVAANKGQPVVLGKFGYTTPVNVKVEPVDYAAGGVILKSDSPDNAKSVSTRQLERTLIESRQKKKLSKPVSLTFGESPQVQEDTNVIRCMSVDRDCYAYKNTLPYFISFLISRFKDTMPSATFLHVENSYMNNFVTLYNIEQILNDDNLEDSVIDTWGLLINQKINRESTSMQTRTLVARQTYLFRSFCWLHVARYDVENWYKHMCAQFIDKKILDALRYDTWLFPINTTGGLDPRSNEGNHWTLLRFSVKDCTWTFYNPLMPQSTNLDSHYTAAMTLVAYVEKQIKNSGCGMRLPIFRPEFKSKVVYEMNTPQQAGSSLDCGVVVCSVMETIICRRDVVRKVWNADDGGVERAKMVNLFCDAVMSRCG